MQAWGDSLKSIFRRKKLYGLILYTETWTQSCVSLELEHVKQKASPAQPFLFSGTSHSIEKPRRSGAGPLLAPHGREGGGGTRLLFQREQR